MAGNLVDHFGNPLVGPLVTSNYRPMDMRYFTTERDLPPMSMQTIELMRKDSMVKLCLGILGAPIDKMELAYKEGENWKDGILADDAMVAEFVQRQVTKLWDYSYHLITSQIYGWAAGEVLIDVSEESGLVEITGIAERHARDVQPLTQNGELCGVRFKRLGKMTAGQEDLGFPKCFWVTHNPDPGMYHGTTCFEAAYSPWWDKHMRGGALDVRRLFMFKDAFSGKDLAFPYTFYTNADGTQIHAKDIARQFVEQTQAGAVTTRPYDADPTTGKNRWELTDARTPNNPQHILQYPQDLDDEIRRGMGVNDDVINTESTGSFNGKGLAMYAFLTTRDEWCSHMLRDLDKQVIRPIVEMNFGTGVFYELNHKPFAEQLKEQLGDSPDKSGGGVFAGARPPIDGDNDGFVNDETEEMEPDAALRMSYAKIGQGVVKASKIVEVANQLVNG